MQERFGLDKHAYERSCALFRYLYVFILIFSIIFLDICLFVCMHTILCWKNVFALFIHELFCCYCFLLKIGNCTDILNSTIVGSRCMYNVMISR